MKNPLRILLPVLVPALLFAIYKAGRAHQAEQKIQAANTKQQLLTAQIDRLQQDGENRRTRSNRVRIDGPKAPNGLEGLIEVAPGVWAAPGVPYIDRGQRQQDIDAFVPKLRQKLEEQPGLKIPELKLLPDEAWVQAAGMGISNPNSPESAALADLRLQAKKQVAEKLASALDQYAKANDGKLPSDVKQLAPFLPPTIDAEILDRYQMTTTGNMEDYERDALFIKELAPPADPDNDTLMQVGGLGYWLADPIGSGPASVSRPSGRKTCE